MRIIGIFGGTFDPIHCGHLETARHVYTTLGLDHVRFVLSARPPHRVAPVAPVDDRTQMLRLAVENEAGFVVDDREQQRRGPSYTVWTLRSLRAELPQQPLALLLGADAFLKLDTWFCWQQILALTHLIVLPRPGSSVAYVADAWYRDALSIDVCELERVSAGRIYVSNTPLIDVSASSIREKIGAHENASADVPDAVWAYIQQHGLYGCAANSRHEHAV